jgi:hypothetical protein
MFIGHFAVGFAAKKFAPRTNMALLIAAPCFLDLLWPFFLLLSWEHVRIDPGNTRFTPLNLYDFPWSHSLLMSIVWATLFALIYHLITRYWPGTVVIWIGVISHWVLDWITHRPDMPLYPGGARYGLGGAGTFCNSSLSVNTFGNGGLSHRGGRGAGIRLG